MKTEGNRLAASHFTWEKYCAKRAWAISQLVADFGDTLKLQPDVTFIGWCQAKDLPVRPRTVGYAVMVEIDGEDTWFHSHTSNI